MSFFPRVRTSTGSTNGSTQQNNIAVSKPSGIQAGEMMLLLVTADGGESISYSTGWTELSEWSAGAINSSVAYRIVNNSPQDNCTLTFGSNSGWTYTILRIDRFQPGVAPELVTASGNSLAPNSGSLNPSAWGVEDTLWLAYAALDQSTPTASFTGFPSGYTDVRGDGSSFATYGTRQQVTSLDQNVDSADPGAYSLNTSRPWTAATIGIRGVVPPRIDVGFELPVASTTDTAVALIVTKDLHQSLTPVSEANSLVDLEYLPTRVDISPVTNLNTAFPLEWRFDTPGSASRVHPHLGSRRRAKLRKR